MYEDNLYFQKITAKNRSNDALYLTLEMLHIMFIFQSAVWIRHANQLQPSNLPETKSDFPLDIILNTFELPPQSSQVIPRDKPRRPKHSAPRESQ